MRAFVNNTRRFKDETFLREVDQIATEVRLCKGKIRKGDTSIITREKLTDCTSKLTEEQKLLL